MKRKSLEKVQRGSSKKVKFYLQFSFLSSFFIGLYKFVQLIYYNSLLGKKKKTQNICEDFLDHCFHSWYLLTFLLQSQSKSILRPYCTAFRFLCVRARMCVCVCVCMFNLHIYKYIDYWWFVKNFISYIYDLFLQRIHTTWFIWRMLVLNVITESVQSSVSWDKLPQPCLGHSVLSLSQGWKAPPGAAVRDHAWYFREVPSTVPELREGGLLVFI